MELTNYSFLQSRNEYMTAIANRKVAADRVATGERMERSGADVGSVSQLSNYRTEMISDRQSIINLQNLRSFLFAQENSLNRVVEMYDKMEVLALKAANPTTTTQERADYEIEFSAYREQLDEIMKSRYNGALLFSSTEMCGGADDIPLGALNVSHNSQKNGMKFALRASNVEVGSPSGTLSFRVNSGGAGDIYRVFMGGIEVFSMGPSFKGSDPTIENADYQNGPHTQTSINNNGWKTSGRADNGDDDEVFVTFGPGKETTYEIKVGASNRIDNNTKDLNGNYVSKSNPAEKDGDDYTGKYSNISTFDLHKTFDETELTLQTESATIAVIYGKGNPDGVFEANDLNGDGVVDETPESPDDSILGNTAFDEKYSRGVEPNNDDGLPVDEDGNPSTPGVTFIPSPFVREIPKDRHGNNILLKPKGFNRFLDDSLATPSSAQEAVDKMRGNGDFFGEMKCIVENRIGILGSEYKRIDEEIRSIEEQIMSGEVAMSRIRDADIAKEATALARENLKSELATQVMANSSRLKDVLIPLTTNHFRGAVTNSSL